MLVYYIGIQHNKKIAFSHFSRFSFLCVAIGVFFFFRIQIHILYVQMYICVCLPILLVMGDNITYYSNLCWQQKDCLLLLFVRYGLSQHTKIKMTNKKSERKKNLPESNLKLYNKRGRMFVFIQKKKKISLFKKIKTNITRK